jgi:hypothetical protein
VFDSRKGQEFFSLSKYADGLWDPPKLLLNWYGNYILGSTVVGRKVDHSPPFHSEVSNTWNYTSTPECLHGVHMEKFTLFLGASQNFEKGLLASSPMPLRLSVRLSTWNNSAPTLRIFMKFNVWVFCKSLSRKFKFH